MHYRIHNNIYVVGGKELSSVYDNNVYLIVIDEDELVLYDIGSPWGINEIIRNILELGLTLLRIKYLVISHAHIESSGAGNIIYNINKNVKIIAHEPDATRIRHGDNIYTNACMYNIDYPSYPITISIPFTTRKYVLHKDPYVIIYHTPGHTKGLISLIYEDRIGRIALVSDILGPLCESWGSSYEELVYSLEFIRKLDCNRYCTSIRCYTSREFNILIETIKEKGRDFLRVQCCSKKYG